MSNYGRAGYKPSTRLWIESLSRLDGSAVAVATVAVFAISKSAVGASKWRGYKKDAVKKELQEAKSQAAPEIRLGQGEALPRGEHKTRREANLLSSPTTQTNLETSAPAKTTAKTTTPFSTTLKGKLDDKATSRPRVIR